MAAPKPFYITTPIYYVNARPHIGHLYTTTVADVIARYRRLKGEDVFFLTGTDEHGKKVADSARAQNLTPQQFVDQIAGEFEQTFVRLQISNDDFIRTTQPRHETRVQQYVQQLLDSGDVYLGEYEGWYDPGQEEYVAENNARGQDYKSAISGKSLERVREHNYFFRLSQYEKHLREHIEANPQFIAPQARRNEVLGRIREGLNDVAVSRSTEPWGVAMPGDQTHSIYVWIDALLNYRSALEAGGRQDCWPADVHLIGKEILWFHAVVWPAMLMALDWPLPGQIYAHSFWISEGRKMSKSMDNFIDLEKIDHYVNTFGLDALRYFLATQGPMGATDSDFAEAKFIEVYNSELANTLGNCASRVTNMIGKYFDGKLPASGAADVQDHVGPSAAEQVCTSCRQAFDQLNLEQAASSAFGLLRAVDGYIEATKPFSLAKDEANMPKVGAILYNCLEALRIASILLWPILPNKCEAFWRRIGCQSYAEALTNHGRGELENWCVWGQLEPGTPIEKGDALFPRYTP